jgi:hypothetical protein
MQRARNLIIGLAGVVVAIVAYNLLGTSGPVSHLVVAPTPFGFAEPCTSPSPRSPASEANATRVFAISSNVTGPWRTVYSDGGLGINADTLGETAQVAIAGNTPLRYELSPAGIALITGRVVDAGITPGCRRLATTGLTGELLMWTDKGYYDMAWGPGVPRPTLRLSRESETKLGELLATLTVSPISLPDAAWTAGGTHPSLLSVHHWLLLIHVVPTDGPVSDDIDFYHRILLPGGVGAVDFGAPIDVPGQDGPGSSLRCGVASPDDADRLASSLNEDSGGGPFVVTPDGSALVKVTAEPIFVPNYGCAELAADLVPPPISGATMPAVTGLLAGIDACGFVSDKALRDLGADTRTRQVLLHPFGVPVNGCAVSNSETGAALAFVTLYPERAVGDTLEQALSGAFGQRPPTESIGAHSVFHQADIYAINNREELVAIEFSPAAEASLQRGLVSAVAAQAQ